MKISKTSNGFLVEKYVKDEDDCWSTETYVFQTWEGVTGFVKANEVVKDYNDRRDYW